MGSSARGGDGACARMDSEGDLNVRLPQPAAHRSFRGRARVPRRRARVRGGADPAAGAADGRGVVHPARADRRLLRARADGDRDSRGRTAAAGATFFMATIAIEELARVDAVGRGAGRRAEHARQQRAAALGQRGAEGEVLPAAGVEVGGRLRAERGGLGLGRLRARVPRRGQGRPLRAHRAQALDHERRRGGAVHRDGDARSRPRATRASRASWSRGRSRASASASRRTSSASAPPRPAS